MINDYIKLDQQDIMRRPFFHILLLLVSLTVLILTTSTTVLKFEDINTVIVSAEQHVQYSFTVPESISEKEEIYIRAEPLVADPFQAPYLRVSSSNNYRQNCFNAHSQFLSYCRIPAIEVKKGREFKFEVSCSVECHLNISVYISKFVKVRVGEQLELTASDQLGQLTIINVPIPLNDSYSGLAVNALISNLEESIEFADGLVMLINYGDRDSEVPTEQKFQVEAEQMYSGGRFSYLTREKVGPGSWLKVYLKLKKGMRVVFSVMRAEDRFVNMQVGRSFFDLVKRGEEKVYLLNTSTYYKQIENKTIQLVFDKFAGTPDITLGFDSAFLKKISVSKKFQAVSVELSPALRIEKGFNKLIYISVIASEDSQFYFYSQLTREDATFLKPYIAYFEELDNKEISTYILDERYVIEKENKQVSFLRNYTFKVDVLSGKGRFLFTRCKSLQKEINATDHSLSTCLKKKEDLKTLQFVDQEIEAKTISAGGMMVINMEYDISKCPLVEIRDYQRGSGGREYRGCVFQMIAEVLSPDRWTYIVTAQRKYHISYLHEGKMTKQYLPKDSTAYYVFSLPDYANVDELSIFSITYSGQSVLIVSKNDRYPTLQTKNIIVDTGSKTNIVLKGNQLDSEIYVAVIAKSFTEVNVGVVVHRKGEDKNKEIKLQNGNILPYTLNRGESTVRFRFVVKLSSDIVVQLNELVGFVDMKVFGENKKEIACKRDGSIRSICRFLTDKDSQQYTVVVTGQKSKQQQFTISYSDNGRCKAFALNTPIYVQMEGIVMNCYTFLANRAVSLKYVSSLTGVQTVQREITVDIAFNGYVFQQIYQNQHEIALRDMITQCPLGKKTKKSDFISSCNIQLRFFSKSSGTNNFYFLLEEIDQEMLLFDGILERVTGVFVFASQPKYFYYRVTQDTAIKIFASTSSFLSEFLVVASLVSKNVFAKRQTNQEIYPKFIPSGQRTNSSSKGLYFTTIGKTGTSVISIGSDKLSDQGCNDSQCWLLIVVYPDVDSFQSQEGTQGLKTSYELEVTQRERTLELGQTKTGFVTQGSVQVYVVSPADGLVTLRNVENQDLRNGICASVAGGVSNGTITKRENIIGGGYLQLNRTDGVQHIVVRGTLAQCSYQITYQRISQPVHNAKLSQPYALDLQTGEVERFLYYHTGQVSFRIVKLVSAGIAEVFIYPIHSREESLAQLLKKDYKSFPIVQVGDRPIVFSQDQNFCQECYYLVVFAATSKFVGEVIFLRERDPIPLSTNHALKDWLLPNSIWSNATYIYYSLTDFNLTFQVITGSIQVTVRDPKGTKLYEEEVKERKNFKVQAMRQVNSGDVEFYSQEAKYQIEVKGLSQSQFYLKIDKNRPTERIYQGMPSTFQITRLFPLALQFINSEKMGVPLSLMVQVKGSNDTFAELQFNVNAEGDNGKITGDRAMVLKKVQAEHTYILTLKSIEGSYYVSITTTVDTILNILLMRRQLTQLSPFKSYLLNGQGIFQLYSSKKKMLVQIYNCVGDFYIFASKDIREARSSDLGKPSPITLRRPNYGGHYVFQVDRVFSSYYMRISPKDKTTDLQYFISYSYNQGINPYELIDANNYNIDYRELQEGITLSLSEPKMVEEVDKHLMMLGVTYYVYISASKNDLMKYSRCGIDGGVIEIKVANITNFMVQKSKLQSLIEREPRPDSLFITVQATIQVSQTEHKEGGPPSSKLSQLTMLYNVVEVPLDAHKFTYWFTDNLLILLGWMFLPFVLAGIIVFYLLKCCIRRLMSQQANMVEEEIVADPNSRPTVATEQRIDEGIVHPDSAAVQMVKEHI